MWIVIAALWIYNMTVTTGHFDVLRRSFGTVSDDQRIQAIIIAFCFGGLLEALAGFGTPVAISAVMLIALGFTPIKAAVVALVANTAPVAFGAIAVPITTLAKITGLPVQDISSVVGRQTPVLALFVPLVLVFLVDGRRGLRQCWLPAVVGGVVFALGQFVSSNYLSVELTDIIASLLAAAAIVALLRFWQPSEVLSVEQLDEDEMQSRISGATASAHAVETGGSRRGSTRSARSSPDRLGTGATDEEQGEVGREKPARPSHRDLQGLLAVPDHHRRLLDRADRCGQVRAGRGVGQLPLAGPEHRHAVGSSHRPPRRTRSTGCPRPAPCC